MPGKTTVIGVFTDTHYSRRPDDGERFFSASLEKTKVLCSLFKQKKVDFTLCLGDLVDYEEGNDVRPRLEEILAVWRTTGAPLYLCLGNHDISALPRKEFTKALNIPGEKAYRSFDHGGVHFVILDTNYNKDGVSYTARTMRWDNCFINTPQLEWLEKDLAARRGPAVVFTHACLDPRYTDGVLDPHVVKNHEAVHGVFLRSGRVKLVFQGHYHRGRDCRIDGIRYFTLPAVVEGRDNNYGLVIRFAADGSTAWKELFPHEKI
jgi:3',5'-cyclic AMP phosphodiesterase CpdA